MPERNMLLLEIQEAMGCPYLSDLCSNCRYLNERVKNLIMDIPTERYSLRAWNEAVSYITDNLCFVESIQKAKKSTK